MWPPKLLTLCLAAALLGAPPAIAGTTAPPASSTASPAAPALTDFAGLFVSGTVGENAPELATDFSAGATLGSAPLGLEQVSLDDLASRLGGSLHATGDAATGVTWLCFTQHARSRRDVPRTVWFVSSTGAATGPHALAMVIVENVDAARRDGCTTASPDFAFPSFGIPVVGARRTDLKHAFGSDRADRQGNVYYNSTRPAADGSTRSIYQRLGYRLDRAGLVTGFAIAQVTTD
jgi:hypothetical protein